MFGFSGKSQTTPSSDHHINVVTGMITNIQAALKSPPDADNYVMAVKKTFPNSESTFKTYNSILQMIKSKDIKMKNKQVGLPNMDDIYIKITDHIYNPKSEYQINNFVKTLSISAGVSQKLSQGILRGQQSNKLRKFCKEILKTDKISEITQEIRKLSESKSQKKQVKQKQGQNISITSPKMSQEDNPLRLKDEIAKLRQENKQLQQQNNKLANKDKNNNINFQEKLKIAQIELQKSSKYLQELKNKIKQTLEQCPGFKQQQMPSTNIQLSMLMKIKTYLQSLPTINLPLKSNKSSDQSQRLYSQNAHLMDEKQKLSRELIEKGKLLEVYKAQNEKIKGQHSQFQKLSTTLLNQKDLENKKNAERQKEIQLKSKLIAQLQTRLSKNENDKNIRQKQFNQSIEKEKKNNVQFQSQISNLKQIIQEKQQNCSRLRQRINIEEAKSQINAKKQTIIFELKQEIKRLKQQQTIQKDFYKKQIESIRKQKEQANQLASKNKKLILEMQESKKKQTIEIQNLNQIIQNMKAEHQRQIESKKNEIQDLTKQVQKNKSEDTAKNIDNKVNQLIQQLQKNQRQKQEVLQDLNKTKILLKQKQAELNAISISHQEEKNQIQMQSSYLNSQKQVIIEEKNKLQIELQQVKNKLHSCQQKQSCLKGQNLKLEAKVKILQQNYQVAKDEINGFKAQLSFLEKQFQSVKSEKQINQKNYIIIQKQNSQKISFQEEIKKLKESQLQSNFYVNKLKKDLQQGQKRLESQILHKKSILKELDFLKLKKEEFQVEINQKNALIEGKEADLAQKLNVNQQLKKELGELKIKNSDLNLIIADQQAKIRQQNELRQQAYNELRKNKQKNQEEKMTKIQQLELELQRQKTKFKNMKDECDDLQIKLQGIEAQLQIQKIQRSSSDQKAKQFQSSNSELQRQLKVLKSKKDDQSAINKLKGQIKQLEKQIQQLKDMIRDKNSEIAKFNKIFEQNGKRSKLLGPNNKSNQFQVSEEIRKMIIKEQQHKIIKLKQQYTQIYQKSYESINKVQLENFSFLSLIGIDRLFDQQLLFGKIDLKFRIISQLYAFIKKPILRTQLLYKMDPRNPTSFHKYIDHKSNLFCLVKTRKGAYLAGYYSGVYHETSMHQPGILLSITNNETYFLHTQQNNKQAPRSMIYDAYFIIFGNAELRIRSGENKIFSNFGIANSYYNNRGKKVGEFLCEEGERQVEMQSYEVYELTLKEEIQNRF